MKTITVNVSEPVYNDFQDYAKSVDRKTSELIREAMEDYRDHKIKPRTTLLNIEFTSVGEVLQPLVVDDLMDEMLK